MNKTVHDALRALNTFVAGKAPHVDIRIETDPQRITDCVQFMERVFPDFVVVICARNHVEYVSPNCSRVIGYDNRYFKSLTLGETLRLFHEEDVNGFKKCVEKMNSFIDHRPDLYKFIFHYRLRKPDGEEVIVRDEKMAIETEPGKFIFLTLLQNVSEETFFSGVKLVIWKRQGEGEYIPINEFCPKNIEPGGLSARQADVARLISRGLANKAIADKLHLSISTVKNHKKTIFKKINVKNSLEMLASMSRLE